MICPQCNNEIKEGAKFCPRCGVLIPKPKRCSKCESSLEPSNRFCPVCGAPNLYYKPTVEKPVHPVSHFSQERPTMDSHIKEEPFAPLDNGAVDLPPLPPESPSCAAPVGEIPPVVPPPMMIQPPQKANNIKIWLFISVGVAVISVGILLYTLLGDSIIEKVRSRDSGEYENRDSMEYVGDNDYAYGSSVTEVVADSSYSYRDSYSREREPERSYPEPVRKVSVPDASYVASSEAYDIYPRYMTDYSIGEEWRDSDIARRVFRNGGEYYLMAASGFMDDIPVSFQAVIAPDNRIYGRYHNSNGTKLDLNGVQDSSGNLIIKLAHGDYTSYWILTPDGSTRYSGTGTYNYTGTWGHNEKYCSIDIQYYR